MNELLDFIREFDIHNLLSIAIIFWLITRQWRSEIKEWKNEVKEETASFRKEMAEQAIRSDRLHEEFLRESADQSRRSDRLYEMFYELIKEKK